MICMVILSKTNSYFSNQSNTMRSKHELNTGSKFNNRISLTRLPNELLFSIIERIPVNDLICTLPRICSQFDKITKLTCNRRRSLNVFFGDSKCLISRKPNSPIYTLKFDTISQLNEENVKKIISTFPNVRSLKLIASGVTVSQLNESITDILLSCLYDQLEALHLELTFEFQVFSRANTERTNEDREQMRNGSIKGIERVSKLINRMSLLRRLTLGIFQLPRLEPSLIAQLNEFYIFSSANSNRYFESLLEHGAQLKHIGIGNLTDNIPLRIRTRKTRIFLSKITHFDLFIDPQTVDPEKSYPIDSFRDLLLCMSNLCELSVNWLANRPLDQLIRALQPITHDIKCSNLVTLQLNIVHDDQPVYDETPLDLSSLVDCIQLRSIKQLQLSFCAHSHQTYQLLHLESIFPNLRAIHYANIVSDCLICGFDRSDYFDENERFKLKRTKCINLMVHGVVQMAPKPEIIFTYTSKPTYKRVDLNFTLD